MFKAINTNREYDRQLCSVRALMHDGRTAQEACEMIQGWHLDRWGSVGKEVLDAHDRILREIGSHDQAASA